MTNPTNELYLLSNVDLDPDYNYTLDFDNETAQHTYFENKVANVLLHTDDYSYIRADQSLKVYANIDTLNSVNYLMYKNADKWYYGFVTKKEYVSDNVTRLIFKIDPLQTFMFNYSLEESFIDREHQDRFSNDGKPIYNTQEENLEIGSDYNVKSTSYVSNNIPANAQHIFYLVRASERLGKVVNTWDENTGLPASFADDTNSTTSQKGTGRKYTDDYLQSGVYCYLVPSGMTKLYFGKSSKYDHHVETWGTADELLEDPRVLSVTATTYLPKGFEFVNLGAGAGFYFGNNDAGRGLNTQIAQYDKKLSTYLLRIVSVHDVNWLDFEIDESLPTKPTSYNTIVDYTKETKLLTYPFSYLRLNTFNEFNNLKRENFINGLKFGVKMSISNGGGQIIFPKNHNGKDNDYFNAIQPRTTNDISLRTDKWQDYTLNNKASMNGNLITSGLQAGASLALGAVTGGVGLAVAGGALISQLGAVSNELQKRKDIKNQPDTLRPSINDTTLTHAVSNLEISVDFAEIKPEYKIKVAKYFNHYGYKCNDFKKPNVRSRYYFNYIKTIGANIKSNIDADYKAEIANIFDNGLTIWHYRDATTFKGVNNFEYENAEISIIGGNNGN